MCKSVMMSDIEPIDPVRNPVMTLEEAKSDYFGERAVEIMGILRRDKLTRLQFIEYITRNDRPFNWSMEHESLHLPSGLQCEEFYIPSYLKKRNPVEVNFWPNGKPDDLD